MFIIYQLFSRKEGTFLLKNTFEKMAYFYDSKCDLSMTNI